LEEIKMRKWFFLLVVGMVMVLALSACGGGGDSEPADAPAAPAGDAVAGEPLFQSTCAACHGPDAKGMPNLGKDLTTSDFLTETSDADFLEFIKTGRPASHPDNTTGVDMPPKGGNPALDDEDLVNIIAYVRTRHE
jgi:mono/diheme cytochrome c family protein